MARPRLRARFFVHPDGVVFERDKPLSSRLRMEVFRRDQSVCQHCGVQVRKFARWGENFLEEAPLGQVDHIFPISRGGRTDLRNLQLLCIACNNEKGVG